MKDSFTDPETGWLVTHESLPKAPGGRDLVSVTITNPETGETHTSLRSADAPEENIAEWIDRIAQYQASAERSESNRQEFLHQIYPELATGADLPNGPLPNIKLHFARAFATWNIHLPEDDVANRRRGKIKKAGWAIWYLFDADEKGEFLDYYCAHRMTEDDHLRVYENGATEDLPVICGMRRCSADPEEDARWKAEHLAENQRAQEILEAKGFGIEGDEPGGVQIQRYLRTQKPKDS